MHLGGVWGNKVSGRCGDNRRPLIKGKSGGDHESGG